MRINIEYPETLPDALQETPEEFEHGDHGEWCARICCTTQEQAEWLQKWT